MSTIDRIVLTPRAFVAWHECAWACALSLWELPPSEFPEEAAEVLDDGRLRIHVTHPVRGVLAELVLAPVDWAWLN